MLDEDGIMVPTFSLEYMMANCPDFSHEMSQLEYVCQNWVLKPSSLKSIILTLQVKVLGIPVDTLSLYHRSLIKIKRNKEQFNKLVSNCFS